MASSCFAAAAVDTLGRDGRDDRGDGDLHAHTAAAAYVTAQSLAASLASNLAPAAIGASFLPSRAPLLHLCGVPALSALVLAVASVRPVRRAQVPARTAGPRGARAMEGLVLLAVPYLVYAFGGAAWPIVAGQVPGGQATILSGQLAGAALTLGSIAAFHGAARRGAPRESVALYATCLAVATPGLVLLRASRSGPTYVVAIALRTFGSVALPAVPTAYAALVARGRATTLAVAACSAAALLWSGACPVLRYAAGGHDALLTAAALLCGSASAALFRYGEPLHQKYFEAPPSKAGVLRKRSRRRERTPASR
jgi:hypothetical protein